MAPACYTRYIVLRFPKWNVPIESGPDNCHELLFWYYNVLVGVITQSQNRLVKKTKRSGHQKGVYCDTIHARLLFRQKGE